MNCHEWQKVIKFWEEFTNELQYVSVKYRPIRSLNVSYKQQGDSPQLINGKLLLNISNCWCFRVYIKTWYTVKGIWSGPKSIPTTLSNRPPCFVLLQKMKEFNPKIKPMGWYQKFDGTDIVTYVLYIFTGFMSNNTLMILCVISPSDSPKPEN